MDDFGRRQREYNYKFHVFRTKGNDYPDLKSAACLNYPYPDPYVHPWNGAYEGIKRGNLRSRFARYTSLEKDTKDRRRMQKPTIAAARRRFKTQLLSRRLRWSMDLGWGGFGLASLFHYKNASPPYDKKYLVAKCNLASRKDADNMLMTEKQTTDRFKNAMHIVQLAEPPAVAETRRSNRVRKRQGLAVLGDGGSGWAPNEIDIDNIMLLEYFPRGSLYKAICTAVSKDVEFPNRVLWQMFHCLIKACIAMAYPPKSYGYTYKGQQPPFSERAPDDRYKEKERFIHWDIDPQNILVGGNEPGSDHPLVPALKLADFGVATLLTGEDLLRSDYMLALRDSAKRSYCTPEQFTQEWDYVPYDRTPWMMEELPRVAGNYSWKTNLFQMGLVMLSLITKHSPPKPPLPQRIYIPPFNPFDPDQHDDDDLHRPTPPPNTGDAPDPPSPTSAPHLFNDPAAYLEAEGARLDDALFGPDAYQHPSRTNTNPEWVREMFERPIVPEGGKDVGEGGM
ncbi:hypothetical protein F5144DRAFT_624109 [Chaetomium tenue]|uniref:Uncharacterized protein n=1 Tax=Chaetomium tenue TaxID=1854479 RepID=A0ACB7NZL1_9PEZI|nr:hypothetical protein F5144DRAFT_624109 [Chaetomium globosum]